MTDIPSVLLGLQLQDLNRMKCEFYDTYKSLMESRADKLSLFVKLKVKTIHQCQTISKELSGTNLSAIDLKKGLSLAIKCHELVSIYLFIFLIIFVYIFF